jgi:hypothetical protein
VPVLEFLRQYTLREYTAVLAVALMGGAGLVFMLNAAGTGSAGSETLALKRETARSAPTGSVRSVEAEALAAARRAKERAQILAERRRIRAMRARRAARRAAVAARARASKPRRRTVVRSAPRPAASAPIRVVTRAPSPAPRPKPAPVSTPTPKKSGSGGGGGGGSFDDSG